MPRPQKPSENIERVKSVKRVELVMEANSITLEELVQGSMNVRSHELTDAHSEVSPFRFDQGVRVSLVHLAKLEEDKARSQSFIRDIEEVVSSYFECREKAKRRPSPASQRAVLLEIRKHADRLHGLLVCMDQDTKDTYCRSVPFPYENVWTDHRITIEQIIHTTERAERRLSYDIKPGKIRNTDLESLFSSLWFHSKKYFPSLDRKTFGTLAQVVCDGAGIRLPDDIDSASRFWALVYPSFPPRS